METYINLTAKDIESLKSKRGGFGGDALKLLGVEDVRMPKKGWKTRALGTSVKELDYKNAYTKRNKHIKLKITKKSKKRGISDFKELINKNKSKKKFSERFKTYSLYLKSKEWKEIKKYFYKYNNKICVNCNSIKIIQLHHKSYAGLGNTARELKNLIPLCEKCHNELHKIQKDKKLSVNKATKIYLGKKTNFNYKKTLNELLLREDAIETLKRQGVVIEFHKINTQTLVSIYSQINTRTP